MRIGYGGREVSRDVQNCIHADDSANKTNKPNVCFRQTARDSGAGWKLLADPLLDATLRRCR